MLARLIAMSGSRRRGRSAERQHLAHEVAPRIAAEVTRLRQVPYDALAALVDRPDIFTDFTASTGADLVMDTIVLWDDKRRGDVRVIVNVWWPGDGRRVKHSLASDSFIVAPNGTFIGEDDASGSH